MLLLLIKHESRLVSAVVELADLFEQLLRLDVVWVGQTTELRRDLPVLHQCRLGRRLLVAVTFGCSWWLRGLV